MNTFSQSCKTKQWTVQPTIRLLELLWAAQKCIFSFIETFLMDLHPTYCIKGKQGDLKKGVGGWGQGVAETYVVAGVPNILQL